MPHLIALTVASYLSCLAPLPGFQPGRFADAMTDAARPRLAEAAAGARNGEGVADAAIAGLQLFGEELAGRPAFITRVGELIDTITGGGVEAAVADSVAAAQAEASGIRHEVSA